VYVLQKSDRVPTTSARKQHSVMGNSLYYINVCSHKFATSDLLVIRVADLTRVIQSSGMPSGMNNCRLSGLIFLGLTAIFFGLHPIVKFT
jgi:hypothetical protein